MSKKKETKTNAMRILDAAHVDHVVHVVDATGEDTGVDIALRAGEDPDHVFKTLVTQGKSGEYLVFMIPVAAELDLKKAAPGRRGEVGGYGALARTLRFDGLRAWRMQPLGNEEVLPHLYRRDLRPFRYDHVLGRAHWHTD